MLQIDDWRDIALPRDFTKPARVRTLGANSTVTGFGYEYDTTSSTDIPSNQGYIVLILFALHAIITFLNILLLRC